MSEIYQLPNFVLSLVRYSLNGRCLPLTYLSSFSLQGNNIVLRISFDQLGVQAIAFDSTYISVSDFYCDVSFMFVLNGVF